MLTPSNQESTTVNQAPFVQFKDYDHEDVSAEFTSDGTLSIIANILASIGVFALLMCAIAVIAQTPDSWLSWLVLATWGV